MGGRAKGPYYVYGLKDPRDYRPFYIGMSYFPKARPWDHTCDPKSAAHQRMEDMKAHGLRYALMIISAHPDRPAALAAEREEIRSREGLVNKMHRRIA